MSKNRVCVTINGKEYTFVGDETQEYMEKIANYLNKKITDIGLSNSSLNMQMIATLTAINAADDYFKSEETADNLRKQVAQYIDDVSKDKGQNSLVRIENEKLKDRIKQLETELAKKDAEIIRLTRNDGMDQTTL